jgi:hypothetical protein
MNISLSLEIRKKFHFWIASNMPNFDSEIFRIRSSDKVQSDYYTRIARGDTIGSWKNDAVIYLITIRLFHFPVNKE